MPTETSATAPLAVVTGASTGIGRALAQELVDHGFDLVIAADEPQIQQARDELRSTGRSVTAAEVDLATEDGVNALHAAIEATGRPVAAAALNVGTASNGRFHETDLADELRVVDLNVRGTVHLAKLLLDGMVHRGEGRLLFTASIAAKAPGPYYATYAASKAFVHSFAEATRFELKNTGVTVTSLLPGPTDTAFFGRADMEHTRVASIPKADPAKVARDGFEAMMAGRQSVVSGLLNKAQAVGSRFIPEQVSAAAQSLLTKPGSGRR